MGNTYSLIER